MESYIKTVDKELASELWAMRKAAKLPRKTVAAHLDVDKTLIYKYEKGKYRIGYITVLKLMAFYEGKANIDILGKGLKAKHAIILEKFRESQTTLAEGMVLLQTCGDPGYPHGMGDDDKEEK